jgi:hypothetical protein
MFVRWLQDSQYIAKNKTKYHNKCRSRCRPYVLERELKKRQREDEASEEFACSPKKARSSFNATLDRGKPQCVVCAKYEVDSSERIYRARSGNCGKNIVQWAIESKNWVVHARLNTAVNAADAEAADIHYHISCYNKLKNAARGAKCKSSNAMETSACQQPYDPLVIA